MRIIQTRPVKEGAGVIVHRSLGSHELQHLDPFLMLDYFATENPDDYIAGFPDHPHRGFITFTYMLNGRMSHRDSMGNRGDLHDGGIQWMKAASGVIHSEMPQQTEGLMRGFQLWINLPATEKMSDPSYQEFSAQSIPFVNKKGIELRLLIGRYGNLIGPVIDPHTDVQYFDLRMQPGIVFEHQLNSGHLGFIYLFEGNAEIEGASISEHSLIVRETPEQIKIKTGGQGARMIVVSGQPINEPIVQQGPFVMNTREEIHQAMRDYKNDTLVQKKAAMNSPE